ncbi:Fur family transcriptional regulator [Ostreibacterium oceani]|uniref:Transcriptional repressor n=1 Tax=Ostreibacterium oceani TaxID=2654998 RepID=A0A6N7EV28_9GAMM|nr:transcriptional repressor [Ostreibacterium oceani]MPV86312.1 transcriptional repressor [Ostreibacterium oceani]
MSSQKKSSQEKPSQEKRLRADQLGIGQLDREDPRVEQARVGQIPSIEKLSEYCQLRGIKLTPLRQDILKILANTSKPLTAYTVLDKLKLSRPKAQVMSVYRVLDFLHSHELIHRIENLNAYRLCCHLESVHFSQWLICQRCGNVSEHCLGTFDQGIAEIKRMTGFDVADSTIELKGTCQSCLQLGKYS